MNINATWRCIAWLATGRWKSRRPAQHLYKTHQASSIFLASNNSCYTTTLTRQVAEPAVTKMEETLSCFCNKCSKELGQFRNAWNVIGINYVSNRGANPFLSQPVWFRTIVREEGLKHSLHRQRLTPRSAAVQSCVSHFVLWSWLRRNRRCESFKVGWSWCLVCSIFCSPREGSKNLTM